MGFLAELSDDQINAASDFARKPQIPDPVRILTNNLMDAMERIDRLEKIVRLQSKLILLARRREASHSTHTCS